MLLAFITDQHFSVRGGSEYFLKNYELFYKNIFFPTLLKNNIQTIIMLGDTWEDRKNLNINALHKTREMFFDVALSNNIKIYTILGNHDIFYRNTLNVNSMHIIESSYPNVTVIPEYEVLTFDNVKFGLMSWINNQNLQSRLDIIKNANVDVMCGHYEIVGFEMTAGHYCEKGLPVSLFSNIPQVYSGHFHIKSDIENVKYLGNPSQTSWGDYGFDKGFHIFDTTDKSLKFIKNTYNVYDVIYYTDDVDVINFDYSKHNGQILKVQVKRISDLNQKRYLLFLNNLNLVAESVAVVEVALDLLSENENSVDTKSLSTSEIIVSYVDTIDLPEHQKEDVTKILLDLQLNVMNTKDLE